MKKKNILFLVDYYHPHLGGAENVFSHIVEGLSKKGFDISIITSKHDQKLPDFEKIDNKKIYRVGTNRLNLIRHGLKEGYKILKNEKFDLIYTTTYTSALPAKILGKLFHKKTIITVHEIFGKLRFKYKSGFKAWVSFLFEKFLMSLKFDIYHTVSWYSYNSLRVTYGISDKKLRMVYNGVDHDFWDKKNINPQIIKQMKMMYGIDKKFSIMYMGHTGKSKGLDYFIKSIPQIIKKYPDTVFILNLLQANRDKEVKSKLSYLKKKYKLLKKQILLFDGTLLKKDLLHRISCADCVIVPSISDGFGLVAAEVSSFGKPLIVSGCSALPEVVSGVIRRVEPGNSQSIINGFEDIRNYILENKQSENIKIYEKKQFLRSDTIDQIEKIIETL